MASNTAATTLAGALNSARQLTRFYLNQAKDLDVEQRFTVGEFTTNSIHWLIAHLGWAEDFLILKGVGNAGIEKPWFKHFELGSDYPAAADFPPYSEAIETFHEVHKSAMELLNDLPDSKLNEKNHIGVAFGAVDTKEAIINHCIRHESTHCGHLGWLLRMQGKKVI